MIKIVFHPQTKKFLKKITRQDLIQVIKKIDQLQKNTFDKQLDIKKLTTKGNSYRLRIGKIRVIYEVDFKKNILYIYDIDFRGNIIN
jgi:Cytotoxic translational repressor of toxin-antitoxin stability system